MMKEKLNPLLNLIRGMLTLAWHSDDKLKAFSELLKLPRDRHGTISFGIDTQDFPMWDLIHPLFAKTKLGPVLILTNPAVIKLVLSQFKSETPFKGNRSTEVIAMLEGTQNIFAASNKETHAKHKSIFKSHLSSHESNVIRVSSIIEAWLDQTKDTPFEQGHVELLSAQIMAAFLLDRAAADDSDLCNKIIQLKKHFVKTAQYQNVAQLYPPQEYLHAKLALEEKIRLLYNVNTHNYPHKLAAQFSKEEALSHIISLMMVGFDNLLSSIESLLINLARYPQYRQQLTEELITVADKPFIPFFPERIADSSPKKFALAFFNESTRLAPQVWLQARLCEQETTIVYTNPGEETPQSFKVLPNSVLLIPNQALGLAMSHEFHPEKEQTWLPGPLVWVLMLARGEILLTQR